ncbi:hypothetical protein D3C75_817390 [compost metagenome]
MALFRLHADPAVIINAALGDGDRPQILLPFHLFHSAHRTGLQKTQHTRPVIGRTVTQMKYQPAGDGAFITAAAAAQCRGDQPVASLEQLVETSQAAETGGKRHLT